MYRIFLIVIVIILYGSLYPWGFHPTQLAASPLWVLIHSWPTGIDRFLHRDIVVNLLIFEPVGVFGFLALQQDFCTSVALIVTLLSALVLSSSIEMNQLFEDGRERTIFDIVLNVSGTAVGIVLGHLYQKWFERLLAQTETSKLFHPSSAILLSYAWLDYQVFPLFPMLNRTRLHTKLRQSLQRSRFLPLRLSPTSPNGWSELSCKRMCWAESAGRWSPLLLLVLPVKLFIIGRTFTWSELVAAGLAYVCSYFLSRYQRRTAVVKGLIVSLLIVRGRDPYQWSRAANAFSWIPVSGFLTAERGFGMLMFFQQCFWYGLAVWLLGSTGWRVARAAAIVVLLLGALEVIQVHIPGFVAGITDPLFAIILAVTLGLSDQPQDPRNTSSSASPIGLHG